MMEDLVTSTIDTLTLNNIHEKNPKAQKRLEPLWDLIIEQLTPLLGPKYSFEKYTDTETECFSKTKYNILVKYHNKVVAAFETSYAESSLNKNLRNNVQGAIGKCSDFRNKNRGAVYTTIMLLANKDRSTHEKLKDSYISPQRKIAAARGHDGMPDYAVTVITKGNTTVIPNGLSNINTDYLKYSNLALVLKEISRTVKGKNE